MSALRDAIVLKLQATSGVTTLATGGVYPKLPPEGTNYPFVTVTAQVAPKAELVFQTVTAESAIYLVKAIDQSTSPKLAGQIAAAIRTALDRATLTITGYTSLGILWVADVDYSEEFNGQIFQHEGGLYSLMASAS